MFSVLKSDSTLFQLAYDDICLDLGEDPPNKGSPEHYEHVWQLCKTHLQSTGIGPEPKRGRWWAIEALARHQRPLRSMTLMLLVFVGFRRG
eukprot:4708619-Alexandrium_andersonii.AAC.1